MSHSASATRIRLASLSEDARARWLDPAEAEFSDHGFEGASLNRIISGAGESKGRTYHYFADKAELFRAALERRLARVGNLEFNAESFNGLERSAYWSQMAAVCGRLTGALQRDKRLATLVRTLHQEAAAQKAFHEPLARFRQQIEIVLAVGQKAGAVRRDLPLGLLADVALNLVVAVDRWFALYASELPDGEEALISERAFSLLMAPLLPPDETGKTDT